MWVGFIAYSMLIGFPNYMGTLEWWGSWRRKHTAMQMPGKSRDRGPSPAWVWGNKDGIQILVSNNSGVPEALATWKFGPTIAA